MRYPRLPVRARMPKRRRYRFVWDRGGPGPRFDLTKARKTALSTTILLAAAYCLAWVEPKPAYLLLLRAV